MNAWVKKAYAPREVFWGVAENSPILRMKIVYSGAFWSTDLTVKMPARKGFKIIFVLTSKGGTARRPAATYVPE